MKLKRCQQGHYYDEDKFAVCPHCSAKDIEPRITIRMKENVDKQITQKKRDAVQEGKALKDAVKDALVQKREEALQESQKRLVSEMCKKPVGMFVLTNGEQSGKIFQLKKGSNYIGFSAHGELFVTSKEVENVLPEAKVCYHLDNNTFEIQSMLNKADVFVNDIMLDGTIVMNAYDKVRIAECQLMFIPICGEHFMWEQ